MEEEPGEGGFRGEGGILHSPPFVVDETINERKLLFDEASACLNILGKDESGVRYAYLMITATEKKLTNVSIILSFKHVLFLDLSGNYLTLEALQFLSEMPFLIYLKVNRNKIESAALNPMPYLQVLILNKNQITETCDINQPMLEYLHLDDNLIYTAQFDSERLASVKLLSLKGNHLLDLSGTYPRSVEQLYLAENRISKFTIDFSTLSNLKVLHLRQNNIRKLNRFTEELENLVYLNLRGNKITKVRQFRKLMCLPKLETLILLENPVCGVEAYEKAPSEEVEEEEVEGEEAMVPRDKTRIPILVLLPNLKRINKEPVIAEEREAAELAKRETMEAIFEELSSEDEAELPTTTDFTTDYTVDTEMDKEFNWETDNEESDSLNTFDALGAIKEIESLEAYELEPEEANEPSKSEAYEPSKSEVDEPRESEAYESRKSEVSEPRRSKTHKPRKSDTKEQRKSKTNELRKSETKEQRKSKTNEARKSGTNEPKKSKASEPRKSDANERKKSKTNEPKKSQTK